MATRLLACVRTLFRMRFDHGSIMFRSLRFSIIENRQSGRQSSLGMLAEGGGRMKVADRIELAERALGYR
jgi:hypothetical protein